MFVQISGLWPPCFSITPTNVAVELLRAIDVPLTIRCGRTEPTWPASVTRLIVKVRFMPHQTAPKRSWHCCALLFIPSSADDSFSAWRPLECFGGPDRLGKVGGNCSGPKVGFGAVTTPSRVFQIPLRCLNRYVSIAEIESAQVLRLRGGIAGHRCNASRGKLDFLKPVITFLWTSWNIPLLSNAEGAEDQVQDVVIGCRSRNFVEGTQRVVKIEKQHFVGNFILDCDIGGGEGC